MLSIRVKDPAETLVALEIDGRNPYEHIRRKNSSLKLFSEIEKRSALKSLTMYVSQVNLAVHNGTRNPCYPQSTKSDPHYVPFQTTISQKLLVFAETYALVSCKL